jgi:hypothetical protein
VAPLQVTRLFLPPGGAPPAALGLHPYAGAAAASPAFELQLRYTGGLVIDVETRIDVAALAGLQGWAPPEAAPDRELSLPQRLLATPAGARLQGAAARLSARLSSTPLRLRLTLTELSGTLRLSFSPPPGDRLWFAFVEPPVFRMAATPSFGQREISHPRLAGWVSDRIVELLRKELCDSALLPNTGDVLLSGLIHPDVPEMDVATARAVFGGHAGGGGAAPSADEAAAAQAEAVEDESAEFANEAAFEEAAPLAEAEAEAADAAAEVEAAPTAIPEDSSGRPPLIPTPLLSSPSPPPPQEEQQQHQPLPPSLYMPPPPPPPPLSAVATSSEEGLVWPPPPPPPMPADAASWLLDSPPASPGRAARAANPFAGPTHPRPADGDARSLPSEVAQPPPRAPSASPPPGPPRKQGVQGLLQNAQGAIRGAAVRALPSVQRALHSAEENLKKAHARAVLAQQAAAQRKLEVKRADGK